MHISGQIAAALAWVPSAFCLMEQGLTAERLYLEHRQKVFHLCLRLGGGNISWAEDATHDVFIKLIEKLDQLADKDDLGGWIYRVTMNTCLTRLKRQGSTWSKVRRLVGTSHPRVDSNNPERKATVREELKAAQTMLAAMPAKQRVVFCMRYLDDQSQREIARTLDLSDGYVSKLLARTRELLQQQGWEAPDA